MNDDFAPRIDGARVAGHLRRLAVGGFGRRKVAAVTGLSVDRVAQLADNKLRAVPYREAALVLAVDLPGDVRDTSWTDRAECARPYVAAVARSVGLSRAVDLFYPPSRLTGRPLEANTRLAVDICSVCPVVDACLAYALAAPPSRPEVGVWGGTTDSQRARMRRNR